MDKLEQAKQYQYLWDGSQPGWVLNRFHGHHVDLSLTFNSTGPSKGEMMAVRRTLSDYKSLPLREVIALLRDRQSLPLGRFVSDEARAIVAACRQEGLCVAEEVINARDVLTNEATGTVLLIDDDVVASQVLSFAVQ